MRETEKCEKQTNKLREWERVNIFWMKLLFWITKKNIERIRNLKNSLKNFLRKNTTNDVHSPIHMGSYVCGNSSFVFNYTFVIIEL